MTQPLDHVRAHQEVRTRAARVKVRTRRDGVTAEHTDRVATEEPMEIRVGGAGQEPEALVVTMRTPGDDFELAAGFLCTEGLVATPGEIDTIAYCVGPGGAQEYNVVSVTLRREWDARLRRTFLSTSSCGVCGKASIDEVEVRCAPVGPGPVIPESVVVDLPAQLRAGQSVFDDTGGLHAAGLFTPDGGLTSVREDVGRHNAVDKLVGEQFLAGHLPLADAGMLVSGRASFEIVQKAAVAGIPIVAAVSAPSSLAVDAARHFGMTLIGFLRGDAFNVYAGAERVESGHIA